MVPLSQMGGAIAFQMACDRGFVPPPSVLLEDIVLRQEELVAARDEMIPVLQERVQQVAETVQSLAQEVGASDPTSAARDQERNLTQAVGDLTQARGRTREILERSQRYLSKVTADHRDLESKLRSLQRVQQQKYQHDPYFNFIEEGGKRACSKISKPREI